MSSCAMIPNPGAADVLSTWKPVGGSPSAGDVGPAGDRMRASAGDGPEATAEASSKPTR